MIDKFKSDYKIDQFYNLKTIDSAGGEIEFGWAEAESIDLSVPIIISYPSYSKKTGEEDLKKAKSAGRSAATFDDYYQYFVWLTGFEPSQYFEIMSSEGDLKRSTNFTKEQSDFIFALGKFLTNKKRFNILGRGYKLVEYKSERRDETAEVRSEEE